jgi:hypothetical protein
MTKFREQNVECTCEAREKILPSTLLAVAGKKDPTKPGTE